MWSLPASLDLRSTSILGVGHFIVPPDVIVEHPARESSSSIRTIVVPHGIAAVVRRSPIKARKRTPWHPTADASSVVERGGNREWFTDRLFVESKQANLPAACSTSAMVHAVVVILVLLLLAAGAGRADLKPRAHVNVSLRMPAMASLMAVMVAPPPAHLRPPPSPALGPAGAAPPPARVIEAPIAAPLETPSSVEAFPTTRDDAPSDGVAVGAEIDGAPDGAAGGVAGGTGDGTAVAAAATRPRTVGEGIDRPRKIKHVKPVYPLPAMAAQIGGSVIIEATIGADGKVQHARVLRSIAALDQAAVDAVGQWEFEPSRVNGVAVPVIMVVVVAFALL